MIEAEDRVTEPTHEASAVATCMRKSQAGKKQCDQ